MRVEMGRETPRAPRGKGGRLRVARKSTTDGKAWAAARTFPASFRGISAAPLAREPYLGFGAPATPNKSSLRVFSLRISVCSTSRPRKGPS